MQSISPLFADGKRPKVFFHQLPHTQIHNAPARAGAFFVESLIKLHKISSSPLTFSVILL